jgi:alpha-L-fucosidase 2
MCFGDPLIQRLQVNDGTAWSGSPRNEYAGQVVSSEAAADALDRARRAVDDGRFADASAPLQEMQHRYSQSYLPFVDLVVNLGSAGSVKRYRRSLSLDTATHTVQFELDGNQVASIAYASHPHGVLVYQLRSDAPIDFELSLSSELRVIGEHAGGEIGGQRGELAVTLQLPSDVVPLHDHSDDPISWDDTPGASLRAAAALGWEHDGISTGPASARGVRAATVVLSTQTTFRGIGLPPGEDADEALEHARERVAEAFAAGLDAVRAAQLADHGELYHRAGLETGDANTPTGPLDARLVQANGSPDGPLAADPHLAGLLFNYGRYLLICSSREGGVAANLQGIWNDSLRPRWSSNYTTNINVEMNYWQANVAHLAECLPPLYDLIDGLAAHGSETARRLYGAAGWAAHHNTDIWAYTQPVGMGEHDPKWSAWPMAGLWLVRHLVETLEFGAGDDFVRDRVWPPLRGAVEFALTWMAQRPDGTWGTNPSTSPENYFSYGEGREGAVATASALDQELIADALDGLVAIASRLEILDDPIVTVAADVRSRLALPFIGASGRIAEWEGDFGNPDPTHRHLSPLYFAYPGTWAMDEAHAAAVSATLDSRGDESTGWSLAWKIALRARLGQPQRVDDLLRFVFRDMSVDRGIWIGGLYPNLFVAHPPFQIDGNFGYVAGITECLVQSHRGSIELLLAVPPVLASGAAHGLVARPGISVDVEWEYRAGVAWLRSATLAALNDSARGSRTVKWGGRSIQVDLAAGPVRVSGADFVSQT